MVRQNRVEINRRNLQDKVRSMLCTILQQLSWLTGLSVSPSDRVLSPGGGQSPTDSSIDEASRSLGDALGDPTRVRTTVELQCVIDVPWSRRFRAQAIGWNDRGRIPRITGLPARRLSSTLLRRDVEPSGLPGWAHPRLCTRTNAGCLVASLGSTPPPTARNTSRGRILCERMWKSPPQDHGHAANRRYRLWASSDKYGDNLRNLGCSCITH